MKLLMFQSPLFRYRTFRKTLPDVEDQNVEEEVAQTAVIWLHAESQDEPRRVKVLSRTLRNIKWLANKRGLRNVVLHSFTHLAETKADPAFARALLEELGVRLERSGYAVWITPFGYTCEWQLAVYGESLAKVFKSL